MTPDQAAATLLERAGLAASFAPPVDVDHLAEEVAGLDVQEHADLAAVPGAPALGDGQTLSGLLIPQQRRVWVNAHEAHRSPGRRRFTIAHELGHWILHCDGASRPGAQYCRSEDVGAEAAARELERQANAFAAALLMPEQAVRDLAARHRLNVQVLADLFGVSGPAMRVRLTALRLLPDYMR